MNSHQGDDNKGDSGYKLGVYSGINVGDKKKPKTSNGRRSNLGTIPNQALNPALGGRRKDFPSES